MEDNIGEFLKKMGMKDNQKPEESHWDKVIQPNSSYLIVGDVGTGKSGLAYYLLETFSQKYNLSPAVVGLPKEKLALLPPNFEPLDEPRDCTKREKSIVFIDEADLQLPIEDTKARKYVINFLSLPRHRKQIFLLAFHFPRLVLGRYLPFFAAFLYKRPPYLLEFAGKRQNDALTQMMRKAEERFAELPSEDEVVKHTYVVAPRIRWQGMLENPLASFWTQDLSEVWSGTEVGEKIKQPNLFTDIEEYLKRRELEEETVPEAFAIEAEYQGDALVAFNVADPNGAVIRERSRLIAEVCQAYPQFTPEQLKDAKVIYGDYHARVEIQ